MFSASVSHSGLDALTVAKRDKQMLSVGVSVLRKPSRSLGDVAISEDETERPIYYQRSCHSGIGRMEITFYLRGQGAVCLVPWDRLSQRCGNDVIIMTG